MDELSFSPNRENNTKAKRLGLVVTVALVVLVIILLVFLLKWGDIFVGSSRQSLDTKTEVTALEELKKEVAKVAPVSNEESIQAVKELETEVANTPAVTAEEARRALEDLSREANVQ